MQSLESYYNREKRLNLENLSEPKASQCLSYAILNQISGDRIFISESQENIKNGYFA
jgi:hypothetical protein